MKKILPTKNDEKFRPELIRHLRKSRNENQTQFWQRFGVTQSRGSRFELGMEIPGSVAILVKLYIEGTINDRDLRRARLALTETAKPPAREEPLQVDSLAA